MKLQKFIYKKFDPLKASSDSRLSAVENWQA